MALTGKALFSLAATLTKEFDMRNGNDPFSYVNSYSFADDTGGDYFANSSFADTRTLTQSASETLDLTDLLKDAFGDFVDFEKLKILMIENTSLTDYLIVGGAASSAMPLFDDTSDKAIVKPGGMMILIAPDAAGYDMTIGDQLKLQHGGTTSATLTYNIALIGMSSSS